MFWEITLENMYRQTMLLANGLEYSCSDSIPEDILYWPGIGNPYWNDKYDFELPEGEADRLGAFWDEDGDGTL